MPHVLVTGFGAFPGAPRNPTLAILDLLRTRHAGRLARLGLSLDLRVLPVRFGAVAPALEEAPWRRRRWLQRALSPDATRCDRRGAA